MKQLVVTIFIFFSVGLLAQQKIDDVDYKYDKVFLENLVQEQIDAYNKKQELLNTLKSLSLSGEKDKDLATIKAQADTWKNIGRVPNDKRYIEGKFNKTLDGLFSNLKMDKNEIEMIKFENKLDHLSNSADDNRNLDNERSFIRKKIILSIPSQFYLFMEA